MIEQSIDEIMGQVAQQIPTDTDEIMYKGELQNQMKIYILIMCLGLAMFIVSYLINVNY